MRVKSIIALLTNLTMYESENKRLNVLTCLKRDQGVEAINEIILGTHFFNNKNCACCRPVMYL